ncbi:hypothetical protein PoB_002364300 [Plakobranchus ocellatus]|uniref:Uncharacterized protein n=1 Tax=Plakobranchus ocellatus TaxID=259542 RepID=A0AAV3ZRG5_9GAST|nr:hypothetical protein PoB_002364300 [Plakobranchus ocellatus]
MLLHNGGGYPQQMYGSNCSSSIQPAMTPNQGQYGCILPSPVVPCQDYFDLIRSPCGPCMPGQHAALYNPGFELAPSSPPGFGCPCPPPVPPQQTFLHQILTGQGYKNDFLGFGSNNNNNNSNIYSSGFVDTSNYFTSAPSCAQSSCCFGNAVLPSGFSSIQD